MGYGEAFWYVQSEKQASYWDSYLEIAVLVHPFSQSPAFFDKRPVKQIQHPRQRKQHNHQ